MIVCGWCARHTASRDRCTSCGHEDPESPWTQRGMAVPEVVAHEPGRPKVDAAEASRRLDDARRAVGTRTPSVEALAEAAGVDPRTIRRWQQLMSS